MTKAISIRAPVEVELEQPKRQNFDVPDFRHNIELLVEMAEEKIVRSDRMLKQLQVSVEVNNVLYTCCIHTFIERTKMWRWYKKKVS